MAEAIKTVRIISAAQAGVDLNRHKTVNIITTSKVDPLDLIPTRRQATGPTGPAQLGVYSTVVAGPTGANSVAANGLPTVFISGYTGPV